MANNLIFSDEEAKAIQEALKTLRGLGGFLDKTFGIHLQNLVGYLGGDWLGVRRLENLDHILEKTQERMRSLAGKIVSYRIHRRGQKDGPRGRRRPPIRSRSSCGCRIEHGDSKKSEWPFESVAR